MIKIFIYIPFICCILILLLIVYKNCTNQSKDYKPSPRFKRTSKKHPKCLATELMQDKIRFGGLDLLSLITFNKPNANGYKIFSDFNSLPSWSKIIGNDIGSYIKIINGYPSISFSINFPTIECLQNTSFSSFINAIIPIYDAYSSNKQKKICITKIPIPSIPLFLDFVENVITLVTQMDTDFEPSMSNLSWNSDICKYEFRLYFEIKYSENNFIASMFFNRLASATHSLDPRPYNQANIDKSHSLITIDFSRVERFISESVCYFDNVTHSSFISMRTETVSEIVRFLSDRICNLQSNFAYQMLNHNITWNNSCQISNEKFARFNHYSVPMITFGDHVELTTFIVQRTELFSNYSAIRFNRLSSAVTISHRDNMFTMAQDVDYGRENEQHELPSLVLANALLDDIVLVGDEKKDGNGSRTRGVKYDAFLHIFVIGQRVFSEIN